MFQVTLTKQYKIPPQIEFTTYRYRSPYTSCTIYTVYVDRSMRDRGILGKLKRQHQSCDTLGSSRESNRYFLSSALSIGSTDTGVKKITQPTSLKIDCKIECVVLVHTRV